MAYIRTNFATAPTPRETTGHEGLNPLHFHRRFSAAFGCSPKAVITKL